jgi:hypothetical protein
MSRTINPEAAQPSSTQAFEQSDRNPAITNWEGDGGPVPAPAALESRVTQPGREPSADAGLADYNDNDSADAVENEAEREG